MHCLFTHFIAKFARQSSVKLNKKVALNHFLLASLSQLTLANAHYAYKNAKIYKICTTTLNKAIVP
ncbi:hypothetical protein B0181_08515 [Moraxella caviae]|uniref:Uncharacterized protein n=1 Tax=Moraxella caviae TaxID=34060 RepID=A0A1S9ZXW4_9GAMM|nr:hypothetical protein B0181_08515 [Moraxella caviae]